MTSKPNEAIPQKKFSIARIYMMQIAKMNIFDLQNLQILRVNCTGTHHLNNDKKGLPSTFLYFGTVNGSSVPGIRHTSLVSG